jgi:TatD DNase family protein
MECKNTLGNLMELVDTHAHLCSKDFAADLPEVLARAAAAGVTSIVAVGEDFSDALKNLELAAAYPQILPAAGLYPALLDPDQAGKISQLIRRNTDRLVAVGEVGLDFWVVQDEAAREMQRAIFSRFISLALETGLVLNVHSRSAGRHAVSMLLDQGARKVQMHAFDGKISAALPAVEAGFYFSIPPSVVRSRQKQKLVRNLPLSLLLLETDSPVLGADPEVRNEPANIHLAVAAIAELKRISRQEVIETVCENTRKLYGEKIHVVG